MLFADAETGDDKVKAQASEDPCEYIEGHGAGPFKGQDQVDTEVSEKRQALLKMKVALGNDVTDPTKAQVVAPYDFGYTPSQGGKRGFDLDRC